MFRLFAMIFFLFACATGAKADSSSSATWPLVWSEKWQSLSLREGGPTATGYESGKGTWLDAGAWFRDGLSPAMVNGFGSPYFGCRCYFVDHAGRGIPSDANALGQIRFDQAGSIKLLVSAQSKSWQALNAPWLIDSPAGVSSSEARKNKGLSALLGTGGRNGFAIRPPFRIVFHAKLATPDPRLFQAIWLMSNGRSKSNPNAVDYERDIYESFADSTPFTSQSTNYHHAAPGGPYIKEQPAYATLPFPIADSKSWRAFEAIDDGTQTIYRVDGVETARVPHPKDGGDATQYVSPIIDNAFGFSYLPHPGDPPGDMAMEIGPIYAYAKDGAAAAKIPPTPPVPVISWGNGFQGTVAPTANAVLIPVATKPGTIVATISGSSATPLSGCAYMSRGGDTQFALSGSSPVRLETASHLAPGTYRLTIKCYDRAGTPATMPTLTLSVR